jgi:hypothetical protein
MPADKNTRALATGQKRKPCHFAGFSIRLVFSLLAIAIAAGKEIDVAEGVQNFV